MTKNISFLQSKSNNFFLLAGPCVVENEDVCFKVAERVKEITTKLDIPYVFKASYKKANRSKLDSFTGIGDENALRIIEKVRQKFDVPTVTDVHSEQDVKMAADYVDVLQIPAFLCRQTDLLVAAANSGKVVNVKKGQFVSPDAMKFVAEKITASGNSNVLLTDRGTMFGYGDLIVDFRGVKIMQGLGFPVVLDATHSLQQPNQSSGVSGGLPDMIETIASAGVAAGVNGLFMETHPIPSEAKSDGANMLSLDKMEALLTKLVKIRGAILD